MFFMRVTTSSWCVTMLPDCRGVGGCNCDDASSESSPAAVAGAGAGDGGTGVVGTVTGAATGTGVSGGIDGSGGSDAGTGVAGKFASAICLMRISLEKNETITSELQKGWGLLVTNLSFSAHFLL